jgi:hypothetical protein
MSQALFENFSVSLASQFMEAVSEPDPSYVYLAFGRAAAWANDSVPTTANTSLSTVFDFWRNMIGAKKLFSYNFSHAIPRYTWTTSNVYSQFDHESTNNYTYGNQFYVITDQKNVYKCISNNNSANSTVKPTSVNTNFPVQTADGYIWKYMYTISDSDYDKYATTGFIPVKTLTVDDGSLQWDVQENTVDGAIFYIKVTDGGNGYSNAAPPTITITGDGTGATATSTVNAITTAVESISVVNYGTDYTWATVAISGGGGATAKAFIGPSGGHGSDPIFELGGRYLVVNAKLQNSESGVLHASNDFRQIALIQDPLLQSTSEIATDPVYSQSMDVSLTGGGLDYTKDEYVYQGPSFDLATFTAQVLDYNSSNSIIYLINISGTPIADPLIGVSSGATKYITSVDYPELHPYSGKMLYLNNITPITRNSSQDEDFKLILKF